MAIDTASPRSRRALLAAGLGAVAATVASAVGRPASALANDPYDVVLGATNTSDTTTRINYNGSGTSFRTASTSGVGLHGDSYLNTGVIGTSNSSAGVLGTSMDDYGVYGYSDHGLGGVAAVGDLTTALWANSRESYAVFAETGAVDLPAVAGRSAGQNTGVFGLSGDAGIDVYPSRTGVYGLAVGPNTLGVYGQTTAGRGVFGEATTGTGVRGNSKSGGIGVHGDSPSGYGVAGNSGSAVGVLGTSVSVTGVQGFVGTGAPTTPLGNTGVFGSAPGGRGGQFAGGKAQLRLVPSSVATHPSSGVLGDIFLDKNKRLWFCKGGTDWTQLA